jgi:glutathione S-transferase
MSEIVIHGVPGSPYLRAALLGLEEKELRYRLAALPLGTQRSEAHLRLHPFGRIPAIEHGEFCLYETQAILRYVDTLGSGPSLVPQSPRAAARMNQVVGIVDWYVFPTISVGITAERLMSQAFWKRPADEANIATALPQARICIRELERLKDGAEYLAGNQVSLADLMLVPHLEYFRATPEGAEMLRGTSLEGWLTRMSMRASMQATQPERLRKTA